MNAVVCSEKTPNTVWLFLCHHYQKSWLLHKNKDVSSSVIVLAGGANGFAFPPLSMVAIREPAIIGNFHKLTYPFLKYSFSSDRNIDIF